MNHKLSEFFQRHNVQLLDTNKQCAKQRPINYFFSNADDSDIVLQRSTCEVEPLYTLAIPLSNLTRMQEFEDQVFNNMKNEGHYRMFHTLMEQKEREVAVRNKHPAVQLAYEQYSMMLNLCKDS